MTHDDSLKHVFGAVLRQARIDAGLSQESLALQSGLDRTYISLLERGLRQPTLTSLFALACSLRVAPHILIRRTEEDIQSVS